MNGEYTMNLGLTGKKILITGAGRGLGRAIAVILAKEGAKAAIVARNSQDLAEVMNQIGGEANGHCQVQLDLMEPGAVDCLLTELDSRFGQLDGVIHNLGGTLGIREHFASADDYQQVWRFNLGIAVDLNRVLIPRMQAKKWGRVIHISSSAAVLADASVAYSSVKAAVNIYVKGLAQKVAGDGVLVNAVMPGPFVAPGGHWFNIAQNEPERYKNFVEQRMSVKRLGSPDEIAELVAFLCSEKASFISGSALSVDGGMH